MKKLLIAFVMTLCCSLTLQAQLIKEKVPLDSKYLAGAVPVENGKVVLHRTIDITSNLPQDSLYAELMEWARMHYSKAALKFQVTNRNAQARSVEFGIVEYVTFKSNTVVLDRTQIIYHLALQIKGNLLEVSMYDISYFYEEERSPVKMTAEETITDKAALKKNKKDLYRSNAKFRIKTIDLLDQICSMIETQIQ